MTIFWDFLTLFVLILMMFLFRRKPTAASFFAALAIGLAAVGGFFLSDLVKGPLETRVVAPLAEKAAANDLADMFSKAHLATGRETAASLPLEDLLRQRPEAFTQLLAHYGADITAVENGYENAGHDRVAVLTAITGRFAAAIARAIAYAALFILLFVVLILIGRRIQSGMPPPRRRKRKLRLSSVLIGLAAGILLIWAVGAMFDMALPVLGTDIPGFSEEIFRATRLYSILHMINPLTYLYTS